MDVPLDEALRFLDTPDDPYNRDLKALRTVVKFLALHLLVPKSVPPKLKKKG